MKIKHKKVSSFLAARRKERIDASINSIELDTSQNASFLNSFDAQLSLTERELEQDTDEFRPKTERISIIDNLEEIRALSALEKNELAPNAGVTKSEKQPDNKLKKDGRLTWIILSTAGVLTGGLLYYMKKKRFF